MKLIKLTAALAAVFALVTATAGAAPITVGSPLTQAFSPATFNTIATVANLNVPEPGTHPTSPVSGTIIAWHVIDASGGPFKLRVLRPVSGGYLGAGTSAGMTPTDTGLQTFPTNLPIQAGDVVGLDNSSTSDKIGVTPSPGALFGAWVPQLADGSTQPPKETAPNAEIGYDAVVQPAPTLTAISPAFGSIKGGTVVTVAGTDFASVSGVSFGGVPATSFTVAGEGQLTAVAPAAKKAGGVDVAVTTVAGTTPVTAADKFTYKACVVPKLSGKKLKAAKKKLRKASCKLGKVKREKGVTGKTGKVVKQSPKPGKQLAPGSKVKVTLG
ncbi:MAG: PASTA domain-containing protein [Solirubrobacterales bacterium]